MCLCSEALFARVSHARIGSIIRSYSEDPAFDPGSSGHESRTVEFLFFVQPHHVLPRRTYRGRTSSGHESRTVEFLFFVQPHHRRTKPRRRRIHVVATANRRCEGRDDARVVASASPTESQTPEEDASTTPVPRLADARGTPSTIDTTMDTSASSFSVLRRVRERQTPFFLLTVRLFSSLQQKVHDTPETKASCARWSEKQNRSKAVVVNTRRRIWRQFGRRVATVPKSRVVVSRRRRKTRPLA